MTMILLLLILSSRQILRANSQNNDNPYYGVPLGALHYSDGNTRAEAYAANEYTVIFHRFTHRPRQPGCTSIIIGPPRATDRNIAVGGVFLSISQPMVASQSTTRRRFTRQVPFSIFGMRNWPVEFDHLELRKDSREPIPSQQKDPFAGIEIDVNSSEDVTPKTKDIHIEGIRALEAVDSSTVSTTTNIFDGGEVSVKIQGEIEQSNSTTETIITNTDTTNLHTDSKFGGDDRIESTIFANDVFKIEDVIKDDGNNERLTNDGIFPYERNAYPLKQGKLLSHYEKMAEKSSKFDRKDKGFPVMLGQAKPEKWFKKSSQQLSAEKRIKDNDDELATGDFSLSDRIVETDEGVVFTSTQNAAITTTLSFRESTPLYWVIQDPRLKKRRRMELRKKNKYENKLDDRAVTTVATTKSRFKVQVDHRFELPLIEDKTVVFSITNDAKITEYQWIALRDHCSQRTIPLLSLKGIDPPHEEKIGALLGQSHNVTSHRVQILNCNTIFIPGFVFNQGNDPPETYFYAGIGHFPDRIEKQVRAYVVGQPPDQPLRNYNGENVMIRLPKTYRTFDIDFISVFNEIERRSYGHVITPNLLVPPCNDYDVI
ncbi:RE24065p, putative [Brugia malayi]|uniref:RE24065p, putative n=1 Tax=Brugia malayi TaxID=6279 RepID=A0A4E9ENW9_BRUMA|nr:RE24065p, putative [Brugia malayi]VIO85849.1 RE24065p, putative [Brugia malayi]